MKKILLSFMLLFAATAMSAQTTIVKGDMDGNGEITIADVTSVLNVILGKAPKEEISVGGDPYAVDNTLVVGTWYAPNGSSFTLNADGTTDYSGAATYKFRPQLGTLLFFNPLGKPVKKIVVDEMEKDRYLLNVNSTNDDCTYTYYTNTASLAVHDYVDLGLPSGTLWATCNIGANSPVDYGDYFAWGETEGYNSGKTTFNWGTYKWCNGDIDKQTKYCNMSSFGNNGFTDNKTELDLADDAACANWGSAWRMPSEAQIDELYTECTWTWTTKSNVNGYVVTGKNGHSIFLPAAGYRYDSSLDDAGSFGHYWSRTLFKSAPRDAWDLFFNSSDINTTHYSRYYGQSVRPVRASE